MKNYILFLLLLLTNSLLSGQEVNADSTEIFNGTVLSNADSCKIPNAHVLNLSRGTGTATTSGGKFKITVRGQDTLKVSCIGFQDYYILIHLAVLRPDIFIFLEPDTVMMNELIISPLPPRQFFKIVFLETKVPNEKIPDLHIPGIKLIPGYVPQIGVIIPTGPAQLLYDAFNKKARMSRKLRRNRKKYAPYITPVVADTLVFPEKIN